MAGESPPHALPRRDGAHPEQTHTPPCAPPRVAAYFCGRGQVIGMGAHTLLVETMLKTDGEGWAEAVFRLREDMMSDMSGDLLATVLRDSVRYARHEQSALQVSAAFPNATL